MSDLTIDKSKVRVVRMERQETWPAGEGIDAGELMYLDPTTAKWLLADASASSTLAEVMAYATNTVVANMPLTGLRKGVMDFGNALSGLAIGAKTYASDTAGATGTTAGTVSKQTGRVVPIWSNTTPDKLLEVDL